jgi:hypothetical protein
MSTTDQAGSAAAQTLTGAASAAQGRKTLIFANDKSSGKTTTANAVIVSLLSRYPQLMRTMEVREYERHPRLSLIFRKEDGIGDVSHRDARNAAAFDLARELAYDPNATQWDELLYDIGMGNLIVDLGSNMFTEICRILDDEPRPIFPEGGGRVGVVVPVTTASDSVESATAAIDHVLTWGPRTRVFVVEQEYLGRFTPEMTEWIAYRDRLVATESDRAQVLRVDKLSVSDIGSVVFKRIDKIVAEAQATLRSDKLTGAALLRALRKARAEIAWGSRTLDSMQPIADWFAN